MDDYRTRRLDAGSEEPEPEEEAQEEAQEWTAPPPLPVAETPPPLPEEEEAPPPLPEPEAPYGAVEVFSQAPSEPEISRGETVISPMSWQSQEPEVPSPFEEPVVIPEPVKTYGGPEPITPEPVRPAAGGARTVSPSGPGAPEKKNNTPLIIGIVAGVLLLLCCCCAIAVVIWMAVEGDWDMMWLGAALSGLFALLL